MSEKIRVSILGATGYGGGELLRFLLPDSRFEVVYATSRKQAGVPVPEVHRNLEGLTDLEFSSPQEREIAGASDYIIGALPHGASAETLAPFADQGKRVVDLSGDFRLKDKDVYTKWYKREHPRPDLLSKAVYGCPEIYAEQIREASLVASPGCFATAVNLALLPIARKGMAKGTPVVVAMTGSTGSGAEAKPGTHHPTRAETLRPYKFLKHQHTPEIVQLMAEAGSALDGLSFIPISAPIIRGILATVSIDLTDPAAAEDAEAIYKDFYQEKPFVKVLASREPECAPIAGTNYAELRARLGEDGRLHVVSCIDNLVKGGAGQAIECLYLMAGLDPAGRQAPLAWPGMWP